MALNTSSVYFCAISDSSEIFLNTSCMGKNSLVVANHLSSMAPSRVSAACACAINTTQHSASNARVKTAENLPTFILLSYHRTAPAVNKHKKKLVKKTA